VQSSRAAWYPSCFADKIDAQPNGNRFYSFFQRSAAWGAGGFAILKCLPSSRQTARGRIPIKGQDFEALPPSSHPAPRLGNAGDPELPRARATARFPVAIPIGAVHGREPFPTGSVRQGNTSGAFSYATFGLQSDEGVQIYAFTL